MKEKTKIINGEVYAVMVFILDENGNLLLLQRKDNRKWETVKGGVLENENDEKAAIWRVKEETGLEVKNLQKLLGVSDELTTSYGKTKIHGSIWLCQVKCPQVVITEEHLQYQPIPLRSIENVDLYTPIANFYEKKIKEVFEKRGLKYE
mgnify:CR=1 FL=1